MRAIPYEIVDFDALGIAARGEGAGRTCRVASCSSPVRPVPGKSTTLASLIDIVNRERVVHIMTVEDPIEFLHTHKRSLINQREVGEDTHSFANALKHVLRQDPDVILVGEMRDLETISTALTAAETGHLVFATLAHAGRAAVDRPCDRRVPGAPATAGPGAARVRAAGHLHAAARPDHRRSGPRGRVRGDGRDAGDPQPHP